MTESAAYSADPDLFPYASLLDDTLLHLSVLAHHADMGPMHAWRARCLALLGALDEDLLALSITPAQARSLRLSHAVLLDEVTLASCPAQMQAEWKAVSLCQVELDEADGMRVVLEDIDALMSRSEDDAAWLHWYAQLFAAGLLQRRPEAAWRVRRLSDRLRGLCPAADEVIESE